MRLVDRIRLGVARFVFRNMTSHDLYREMLEKQWIDEETGLVVTPDLAMRIQAVFSCVRVLSEDIAALPLKLYERQTRGRGVVTEHWAFDVLEKPNPFQSNFEFREMKQAHIELAGNFYGIKTVVNKEVREILPIPPYRMIAELQPNWRMKYTVTFPNGQQMEVPPERVYHERGLCLSGGIGISPIQWQRETLGWARGLNKYGSRLFRQGALLGGVITHPKQLSDGAAKRLKDSFDEQYSGVDNAQKTILLEEGAQFTVTGMKASDAEFLASKKHSRTEIAGIYRVPPHFIGDLDRATFSNIEQQSLDYVQKGLLPRLRRAEARMLIDILPEDDRRRLYFEHNVDGLLRGDFATRMAGYQTAVLTGWMTRNQVRELENQNPGPAALDEYLVPANELLAKNLEENAKKQKEKKEQEESSPPPSDQRPKLHAIS